MAGFLALRYETRCKRLRFTIRDRGVESSGE
jgi:hypothetical protein